MENQSVKQKKKGNGKIITFICIVLILIALCGFYVAAQGNVKEEEPDLVIQGSIKTTETDINSKLAGNIDQILVAEGDVVKKGDTLLIIDSETIRAKKAQAEAAKRAAQAQAAKAANGARSQEIAQAQAAYEYAEKMYQRIKALYDEEAIPEAQYDQVYAQYVSAKETYDMAVQGAREEDKLAADAAVAQADGAVAEVNSYLEDATIKAPADGKITALNVNEGELVSTGMSLATLTSQEQPWIEVNVKETDLSLVHLDDEVKVTFPAYPEQTFTGKVTNINKKPDFATKRATNNNGDFDVVSYGVRIDLTDISEEIYSGMTVMVNFGKAKSGE